MRGEGMRPGGASIHLLTRGEGWPMAAPVRGARRQCGSTRGRRRPGWAKVGSSGLRRPIGQLGRCEVFELGEEGGCNGLS
jgi:hypothetical protein